MTYAYEAVFEHHSDDTGDYWTVNFPQFDGSCFTDGGTIAEACHNAGEVLGLTIASYIDSGWRLPDPTFHEPPQSVVVVDVDEDYIEGTKLLTVTQAAEELEVSPSRVSQLLSSGQLEAREFHGRRMVTIESLNRRLANPPAPHRPRRELVAA